VTGRTKRGFALLTALWAITVGGVLATASSLVGRESLDAARNRADAEGARWQAEDCLARARATIDAILAEAGTPESAARAWQSLDALVAAVPLARASGCATELHASGSTLDVNAASADQLRRLLATLYGGARAESLTDALLDWRDTDDEPRPHGAEADWYRQQRRHVPRNDSLAHARELARVRGFEELGELRELLTVDAGRISIANAPPAVLAAVPGFLDETVAAIVELRLRGERIVDLLAFGSTLPPHAADSLLANYPAIAQLTVLEPEAWLLTSRGTAGERGVTVAVEVTLVRDGARAVVLRRRGWL
jgi:type II secretory pathway component PulK